MCETCGSKFILHNISNENKKGWGKFCSRKCIRKYHSNEHYFEKIDTPEKAYWLGILFSDGNIYNNYLTLKFMKSDEHHLVKFKNAINSEHPIHQYNTCSSFSISSETMREHLDKIGMMPNKSLKLEYPNIISTLNRHFIRGIFDGDGCISFMKNTTKYKRWSIFSGSQKFIYKLQEILNNELDINLHIYKQGNGFYIATANKKYLKKLFDYLYNQATVYLERKYNKCFMP
jgi:hypothetical protein